MQFLKFLNYTTSKNKNISVLILVMYLSYIAFKFEFERATVQYFPHEGESLSALWKEYIRFWKTWHLLSKDKSCLFWAIDFLLVHENAADV